MAASEEPKHLGRLPASSSWCRAVWESIVELSESLADGGGGAVVQSVECKLVYLLTSMLRAARPFPVVDSRKVFERVLGVYMGLADATNIMTRRLPLLAVLLSTADRLSPLSFSMAQFVTDAIQQVVGKAVDISSKLATEHQFIHGADCDTFAAIALGRLGSMGLGRVLRLAGFSHDSGSAAEVAETKGALKTLHATWESSLPIPDRVLQQSATRILGSTALYAKHLLAEAVTMTLSSASLPASLRPAKENVAESDASRMFRIMSKVALPPAKVANTCSSVLAVLFVANSDDLHSANSPLHFSLQAALLSTLQAHIVSMDSSGAAKAAAREKITDEVAHLVQGLGSVSGLQARSSERALLLWAMLGVAYCGANRDRGAGLLKTVPGALTDMEFCKMVEQQALLLCRHISSNHGDGLPGAEALVVDANGALDVWLKGTFKEWARRHHCSGRQAQDGAQNDVLVSIACSMQKVASAVHGSHRIRHGSTEAQRRIIQGLDLVILAASVAGAKSAAPAASADDFIKVGVVCWLLPLLRGAGVQDACCQQSPIDVAVSDSRWLALFSVAMRDMLGHLGRNSGHSQAVRGGVAEQLQPARQYSVQLRTRVLGLLDLARSEPLRRALRLVLAHLALLGMLPPSDLQRVV
ncbi:hypothetical protein GGI04_004109 [Coemansia thaxteri]|nr:hypothetical protein GGI04_004109 [Coemansia thaxteri]